MKTVVVIPARYASSRLPQKMLLNETGMPLIQHTYLQVKQSKLADEIIIATDHEQIFDAAKAFGAQVVMTDPNHPSGTDRLAEVASRYAQDADLIVNVQGDEPEIEPKFLDQLITLSRESNMPMTTLACPFPANCKEGPGSPLDPNCVKVVLGKSLGNGPSQEALYFSRSLVPFPREAAGTVFHPAQYYMHLGIYAYTPEFLATYIRLPQGHLEQIEKLEQLRILENGYGIAVGKVAKAVPGIDTLADYQAFVKRWKEQAKVEA